MACFERDGSFWPLTSERAARSASDGHKRVLSAEGMLLGEFEAAENAVLRELRMESESLTIFRKGLHYCGGGP